MASLVDKARQKAWLDYLAGVNPQYTVTLTTSKQVSPECLERWVRHWLARGNRAFFGRHWYRHEGDEMRLVWVVETGALGRAHVHALLGHPVRVFTSKDMAWLVGLWRGRGRSQHEPVYDVAGAVRYLTKTVARGGELHLSRKFDVSR